VLVYNLFSLLIPLIILSYVFNKVFLVLVRAESLVNHLYLLVVFLVLFQREGDLLRLQQTLLLESLNLTHKWV